jgi:restriction system protein
VSRTETPDEIMRVAHRQIDASLAQELLDRIYAAPPAFFERLIVNLLLSMGFGGSAADAGRALGRSGDDGVDGVIDQDALGLDRVYIQAKRYSPGNNIGSGAIRDFFGSLDRHKATKGLFVTTSTFSPSARETALSKRIVLIDGGQLAKLMIRHNVGCRVEDILYIKKIDEDFFDEHSRRDMGCSRIVPITWPASNLVTRAANRLAGRLRDGRRHRCQYWQRG